ncbi:DMT family transporter [soil metagenome]
MPPSLFAILLLLAVLWGSAFPGIKLGLEGMSPGHLTLLRHLVASACFVPFLALTGRKLRPERRDVPFFFLLGLLGYFFYHTALNFGELHVSAGAASLIIATAPAFTAVVAYFLLSERLSGLGWLGIGVSLGGVILILLGSGASVGFNAYALLILVSAVVTAFHAVLQKPLFKRYRPVEVTAFATGAGTLPMLIFLPGLAADVATAGVTPLLATVYIGVVPSAVAYTLYAYALSQAPVTLVAAFLYMVPVFSLLFSWLLLGEVPTLLTLVGGGIAISGIALVNRSRRRNRLPLAEAASD